jgi:hypothetical protein
VSSFAGQLGGSCPLSLKNPVVAHPHRKLTFDDDRLATPAIDPAHGVEQKNQKAPEGDELKAPLGELIITGCWLVAAGTDGLRPLARAHGDLDALGIGAETGVLVNESRETMTAI